MMSTVQAALRDVRRVAFLESAGSLSDGHLLEQFLARREEAAFEALVRRHGPMVLGVCRRVLRNAEEAEDAFQATFLVLVRKASVAPRGALGAWLHGVAYRTALKAQARACRRRAKEADVGRLRPSETGSEAPRDWQPLLDEELSRLNERARAAIVLCDLEGKTRREAARQLGIPEGTLSGRLTNARRLLARRLARRGVTLAAGWMAFLTQTGASASVPPPLLTATVQAGIGAGGMISANVVALTEGVLKAMLLSKLRLVAAMLLALGALLGTGLFVHRALAREAEPGPVPEATVPVAAPVKMFEPAPPVPVKAEIGKEMLTLKGHRLNASCVAFSPDGALLATAGADGVVNLWEAKSGKVLQAMKGHDKAWRVAFSPTGDRIVSGGADGTAKVWDVATGRELVRFTGHQRLGSSVHALAFSPDGKHIASGNGSASGPLNVMLWDAGTGRETRTLGGFGGMITGLAFSPDGRRLAVASGDRKLKVFDAGSGRELNAIARPMNLFNSVAFSPDGSKLVTGNDDTTVSVWDSAQLKELIVMKGHSRQVATATFSQDGRLIASSGFDAVIKLWDAATGKELSSRSGHAREVHSVSFNRDGSRLASGSADGVVKIWEIGEKRKGNQ